MQIYIAAPWIEKENMEAIAKKLEANGHTITERWWISEEKPREDWLEGPERFARLRECGLRDMEGVLNADAVLLINSAKSEGKAVEQGLAIAAGHPIVAVGTLGAFSKNVFHYLDNYTWVETVEKGIACLNRLEQDWKL